MSCESFVSSADSSRVQETRLVPVCIFVRVSGNHTDRRVFLPPLRPHSGLGREERSAKSDAKGGIGLAKSATFHLRGTGGVSLCGDTARYSLFLCRMSLRACIRFSEKHAFDSLDLT